MSRLSELIAELCPDGVEYKALGKVASFVRGKVVSKKTSVEGDVPVVSGGLEPAYYIDKSNREPRSITVAGSGVNAGYVAFWDEPIWCGDSFTVEPNSQMLDIKFVYEFLKSNEIWIQSQKEGAGIPHVRGEHLAYMKIPVPPIEVQREIVRILDSFQELDDALTAEIEAREKQYCFAQEACFTKHFGDPISSSNMVKLGTLYQVRSSQRIYQSEQSSDGVSFLRVSDLISLIDGRLVTSELHIPRERYEALRYAGDVPNADDILVTARGTLGRFYFVREEDEFYFQDGMITWLHRTESSPSKAYFSALFSNERFLEKLVSNCGQGTVKYLSIKGLSNTLVPKPAPDVLAVFDDEMQEYDEIACLLGLLRSERDARRKQFAYYRDKLLSFPEKVTVDG